MKLEQDHIPHKQALYNCWLTQVSPLFFMNAWERGHDISLWLEDNGAEDNASSRWHYQTGVHWRAPMGSLFSDHWNQGDKRFV